MKRFKFVLLSLFCVLLMCPMLAGCAEASYVRGSGKFSYSFDEYYTSTYLDIDYSFKVRVGKEGSYYVSYEIEVYQGEVSKANLLETLEASKRFESVGNVTYTVYGSLSCPMDKKSNLKFAINNVKIKRDKESDDFKGYAIGFGLVGGLALCGVTAFFIVDKLVLSKKKDD